MTREIKNLFDTDWDAELQEGDTATRKEGGSEMQVVFLAGLQRLARTAGIVRQSCIIQTPSDSMVQAIFSCTFRIDDDETVTFTGTADCNAKNTDGKFLSYPTAVAESRAEARCLRKALGIRMLSSEEVGLREGFSSLEASPGGKAASQLVSAIEKLCETKGVDAVTVIEQVVGDKDRASSIFELSELTTAEAQAAMSWLNEQKPSSASSKSKRDARKAELKAKQS